MKRLPKARYVGNASILITTLALAVITVGCGGEASVAAPSVLTEPVRVRATGGDGQTREAQFFAGALPSGEDGPEILAIENDQSVIFSGEYGKNFGGAVANTATAVAVKIDELGSGYWVAPVGLPNVDPPDSLSWKVKFDFSRDISPGTYHVSAVGVDESGRYGAPKGAPLLMQSSIPTGDLVVSLTWDVNADLDLHVVAPDGVDHGTKLAGSATVSGVPGDGAVTSSDGLDRDSNAACAIDSWRMEDIVWASAPPGPYKIYVDMFSACGQVAATFAVSVYSAGTVRLTAGGRLLSTQADNGVGPFLFVDSFELTP